MLSRKKRNQTPTFLEGTQGRYVQRESPPRVPICRGKGSVSQRVSDRPEPAEIAPHPPTLTASASFAGPSSVNFNNREHPLSSQSFTDGRHRPAVVNTRKHLQSSVSIGDVVQHNAELESPSSGPPQHRIFSASLQTLPGYRAPGNSIIVDRDGLISENGEDEEPPLPPNWTVEVTPENIRYYVDHNTRRTHWLHPLTQENLPPGWTKLFSHDDGVSYYNAYENRRQYDHPGLATDFRRAPQALLFAAHSESTIENLNIISEDIPAWLLLYARSDTTHDHMLDWNLFPLASLEQSNQSLHKLFKQDVINIVYRYERYKQALNRELNRRAAQIQSQFNNNNIRRPPGV